MSNVEAAPQNLRARTIRQFVLLQWLDVDNATTFRILRRLNTESAFTQIAQTAQQVFSETLPQGTVSAEYFVVAEDASGQSDPSAIATAVVRMPINDPAEEPYNLRVRVVRNLVLLAWQGADGATTFRIFRRLQGETTFVEIGQTAQHTFSDTLPRGAATPEYFVAAEYAAGQFPFILDFSRLDDSSQRIQ
jgi:hypothetical protein